MTEDQRPVQRKLAAILAADIAGYSALIAKDDVGTVNALKGHQGAVLPLIATHSGRLIDTAGDGVLAEFASAVTALECAMAIQKVMGERNQTVPDDRRPQTAFRPGWRGIACYMLKEHEEARPFLKHWAIMSPNQVGAHSSNAANYAQMGQMELARESAAAVLRITPSYTIRSVLRTFGYQKADAEYFADGLRKAGIPE